MNPVIQREHIPQYAAWKPEGWNRPAPLRDIEETPADPQANAETLATLARLEQQAREKGYERGFSEGQVAGLERGRLDAQAELDIKRQALQALLTQVARPLEQMSQETEEALAQLSVVVAERLVSHELGLHPERVVDVVRQALQALPMSTDVVTVQLHPDDIALASASETAERPWRLVENSQLHRGECVMNTPRSRLDARLKTRVAAIADAVLGADLAEGVIGHG